MMQVRQIRLIGAGKPPAFVEFEAGANVVSGDSDTGKSYMLRCMDFVLGATKMTKSIDEAAGYETVLLELENAKGDFLTLARHLKGGDIAAHRTRIQHMKGNGETVKWRRTGKSGAPDITSLLLPFAGMAEASLRSNKQGDKERLTIRTLLSVCLVSETAIIAERSPLYGESGYDKTSRKRMLSYLLTGNDDANVIAEEGKDVTQAAVQGKLTLIADLLKPVEERLMRATEDNDTVQEDAVERLKMAIENLYSELEANRREQVELQSERSKCRTKLQRAESQLLAIGELLNRYQLLDARYETDLKRLDFLSEGAHFFDQLQESHCPLCRQPMTLDHAHQWSAGAESSGVYEAARAEAAKILGLRSELKATISSLESRRTGRMAEREAAAANLERIDVRLSTELVPELQSAKSRLDALIQRRIELENLRSDKRQADTLRALRAEYDNELKSTRSAAKQWADIEPSAVHQLCQYIERVLTDWSWNSEGRVEFDSSEFDIKVDGKPRQSHGKGVRAILHAAFLLGLLKYCAANNKPHPGFLVLDSPLTTFKKGRERAQREEDKVDPKIETGFWNDLLRIDSKIQVIVVDNKEPPTSVATGLRYEYFAGDEAKPNERAGFIPERVNTNDTAS